MEKLDRDTELKETQEDEEENIDSPKNSSPRRQGAFKRLANFSFESEADDLLMDHDGSFFQGPGDHIALDDLRPDPTATSFTKSGGLFSPIRVGINQYRLNPFSEGDVSHNEYFGGCGSKLRIPTFSAVFLSFQHKIMHYLNLCHYFNNFSVTKTSLCHYVIN